MKGKKNIIFIETYKNDAFVVIIDKSRDLSIFSCRQEYVSTILDAWEEFSPKTDIKSEK